MGEKTMAGGRDKVTIKIPRALYERLQSVIGGSGFDSVTDFVVYVLRDIAASRTREDEERSLSGQEIEAIKRRLRNLGYL
jgi:Arc/MetJ-type ribon-helix-helix transcriptional regulator